MHILKWSTSLYHKFIEDHTPIALQGHIGRSVWGVNMLEEEVIIPEIIKLAEESAIFSVRGLVHYLIK